MNQEVINRQEWANPDNWSGLRWLSVYFSKKDSRTWVPKQIPSLGWTVNLGQPTGVYTFVGVLVGIPVLIIVMSILLGGM